MIQVNVNVILSLSAKVMGRASSFKQHYESGYSSDSLATSGGGGGGAGQQRPPSVQSREDEMKKYVRRVSPDSKVHVMNK